MPPVVKNEVMEYEMAFCTGVNDGWEASGPPKAEKEAGPSPPEGRGA